MMQNVKRAALVMMGVGLMLLSSNAASAQTPVKALAEMARTPAEHARVTKEYRQQADALQARAGEFEARAVELARTEGPTSSKWPALVSGELRQAREQAAETWRAERQARALADSHLRLSVEALAETLTGN